jgi:hypothetical protein
MFDSESEIQQLIQMEAMKYGCNLMRNNSGALKDDTGRMVRYGLGNISKKHNDAIKSSDLIGFTTIVVTPDMVGKTVAIFTAVEVKHREWKPPMLDVREAAQNAFLQWVKSKGGLAGFATSIEMFKRILGA